MARWLGVDVGGKRKGFDVAVIDEERLVALRGRLDVTRVLELAGEHSPLVVAIDSPRCLAPDGHTSRDGERRLAKEICQIRWTPDAARTEGAYYAWVHEGLGLYRALEGRQEPEVIEVFPTASWTRWFGPRGKRSRAQWSMEGLCGLDLMDVPKRTNQDQRDAIAAAVTARQHTAGGTEAFGELVVPRSADGAAVGPALPHVAGDLSGVSPIQVRAADADDLAALLGLYAQLTDGVPSAGAGEDCNASRAALMRVLAHPGRHLLVAVHDGRVVGTADLLIAPNITHRGTPWGVVENVVVASEERRRGAGRALFAEITRIARANRCHKLMLLSGKHRVEAHNFYRAVGYDAVCEGFKLYFDR